MKKANPIPTKTYRKILHLLPITCVDLIVKNTKGEVLLLKRKNSPAKGEWWFPGGRVHFMEKRKDAVLRKLLEECGLNGGIQKEIGTYDLMMGDSHAITTVFQIKVNGHSAVRIDQQSTDFAWKLPKDWLIIVKADFVKTALKNINHGC